MSIATPLILIVYAFTAAAWAPRLMRRTTWLGRSPVASIIVWQAITMSAVGSVVLAGTSLALPSLPWTTNVADLLRACADALSSHYATPGGRAVSVAGAALAVGVVLRTTWCVARQLWASRQNCVRHRHSVELVAKPSQVSGLGTLVVDSRESVVYCLPGRDRTIVFTSTALAKLDAQQVAAVLAHEEAHLRSRHHLVLSIARGFDRAFPFVPLLHTASVELSRLVEMHADDAAAKHHGRRALASALIHLAEVRTPAGTLGAAGSSTAVRIGRLAQPPEEMTRYGALSTAIIVVSMIVLPVALAAIPALSVLAAHYCPVDWSA